MGLLELQNQSVPFQKEIAQATTSHIKIPTQKYYWLIGKINIIVS